MGHAAPIRLGADCFRLVPRRPRWRGLFRGGPGAACSAEATVPIADFDKRPA